jgi:hypothetical protein
VNEEVVEDVDKDKEIVEVSDESEEESDDEYEIIAMKPRIRTRNDKRKFNMDLDTTQQKFSGEYFILISSFHCNFFSLFFLKY